MRKGMGKDLQVLLSYNRGKLQRPMSSSHHALTPTGWPFQECAVSSCQEGNH